MAITFDKVNRFIKIGSPTTQVTIQELINAIRDFEDDWQGMDIDKIADCTGKDDLGGGVKVGITLRLINWKVKFDDRSGPTTILCKITGGNLVAVDSNGDPMDPVEPSTYVMVMITSSSSATLQTLQLTDLKYRVEQIGKDHYAYGDTYYWDPINGNDENTGVEKDAAVATFAKAHDLVTDYHHDVIVAVPGNNTDYTQTDEKIVISKNQLSVRGPGNGFKFIPTTSGQDTITITGKGVEFKGFEVQTKSGGSDIGIKITGNNALVDMVKIKNTTSHGIQILESGNSKIASVHIEGCSGDGINIGSNVERLEIQGAQIYECEGNGICVDGSNILRVTITGESSIHNNTLDGIDIASGAEFFLYEGILGYNGGWGIDIHSGVSSTMISENVKIGENVLGKLNDNGTGTIVYAHTRAGYVWDAFLNDHKASGSFGETLSFLKNIEGGRWKIDNNQMIFYDHDNEAEIARFDLRDKLGSPAEENVYERIRVNEVYKELSCTLEIVGHKTLYSKLKVSTT